MRTNLELLEFRLLVALGALPALGCGGRAERDVGSNGSPPAAGGSSNAMGGASQGSGAGGVQNSSSGSGIIGGFPQGGVESSGGLGASAGIAGTTFIGTGGGVVSTGGTGPNPCPDPTWVGSDAQGFVQCSRGFVHRPFKGRCNPGSTCVTDEDCAEGAICFCEEATSMCIQATCKTDDDCPGSLCATNYPEYCYGPSMFACLSNQDQCSGNADCGGGFCEYYAGGRICTICEGRPFLVEGAARIAPIASRPDWVGSFEAETAALTPELRKRLTAAWTATALMEHASVAAFARFSLQLLSLGAPADLVTDSARAMADEIEHAKLAFAAASAYHGGPIGPGALDVEGSLEAMTPLQILILTVREGCVGETIAAAEAAEAAVQAIDPHIRALWQKIAEDETRHAELAWRFVKWVLLTGSQELLDAVAAEFEAALANPVAISGDEDRHEGLAEYGILGDRERVAIRAAVMARVVTPCAKRLFENYRIDSGASTVKSSRHAFVCAPSSAG